MDKTNHSKQRQEAPWWGIGILYLMLTPFAVLGYFAFKALGFVWRYFDGTATAIYAVVVVITGVAWYSIYFGLNSKEIASFRRDQNSLTALSYKMARDKGKLWYRHRLLHSEQKSH